MDTTYASLCMLVFPTVPNDRPNANEKEKGDLVIVAGFEKNRILLRETGQSVPVLKAAKGSPETARQDQPAEYEVGRG
jgi:hypothetical protein